MFGGVEIAAAAMAPYLPRSTKLAASHAALALIVKTAADSRDQRHLQNDQRGSKGGSNRSPSVRDRVPGRGVVV
jgi:hypothetical protein